MDQKQDLFEILKRNPISSTGPKTVSPEIFFQILFNDQGAYLQVVNGKGDAVEAIYEYYSGYQRQVLKSLQKVEARNSSKVQWGAGEGICYLGEHEFLLWPLQKCLNVVDEQMEPLVFSEEIGEIVVIIREEEEGLLAPQVIFKTEDESFSSFRFLTETHVLVKGMVFRTASVGDNYNLLQHFETKVITNRVEGYLSLLFSYFDNISLDYEDYTLKTGETRSTNSALVIENVDSDNTLYLRVARHLDGFDTDFLETYEISRVATCNNLEKLIMVRDVVHESVASCLRDIDKRLKSHQQKLTAGAKPDAEPKAKKAAKGKSVLGAEGNSEYQLLDQGLFIIKEDLAHKFIFKELNHLLTNYSVVGADKLKAYNVRTIKPNLSLSLAHGIDFLEGNAELEIGNQYMPLFDVINQFDKNSYITLSDGSHVIINRDYIKKLKRIFKKDTQPGKESEGVKVSFFDLPLIDEFINAKVSGEAFERSREIFLGFNTLAKNSLQDPPIRGVLRDYQKQGYTWLAYLRDNSLGGCLADDMGLGKTIQAIALLSTIYPAESANSLVIMPRSLLFNWENEVRKFNPEITTCVYHGPDRDLSAARGSHLIFTTYATVRNDIQVLRTLSFLYIILDESQNIKNVTSQTTKAIMLLEGKHRLALSGTPVENNLGELYSLFRFLNPPMFGSFQDFNSHYTTPIQKEDDKTALEELKKRIYPFILRRLKRDVVKDLPEKIEQILYVDMNSKQKLFYEQRRAFYHDSIRNQIAREGINKSQFFILQALTELRQIASIPEVKIDESIISAKQEVLAESILDAIANGHKLLVFANFLGALNSTASTLQSYNIPYLHMTGATQNREKLVNQFQEGNKHRVFLMTLKTGGTGLNLTAADCVYIYDPWWNIAAENQAIDRTHRIGQDKTVFCYKLITRGTIEEKILKLQEIKQELFDALISSDGASIKTLSEDDVEFVLGE